MAEDDLEAFFDDINQAEASVISQGAHNTDDNNNNDNDNDPPQPPAKKVKTDPPIRPRGVVVAAATSVKANQESLDRTFSLTEKQSTNTIGPAPPPAMSLLMSPPPPAIPPPPPPPPPTIGPEATQSTKPHVRTAAGKTWIDPTLANWPDNDFRLFVGNLDPATTDAQLYQHFSGYSSLNQVLVVRDSKGNSKGYGFVSLANALECAKALREQDQSWLQSRPIRIKRSHWKDREVKTKKKKGGKRNPR